MTIRKIELKMRGINGDEREYIFAASKAEKLLHCSDIYAKPEVVEAYVEKNPVPDDKYFDIDDFIGELVNGEGYLSVVVEKEETADYVRKLLANCA